MNSVDVTAAVIRRGGQILLCGRSGKAPLADCFEFPGGKREAGESLSECLEREIREELGTEVMVLDCLGENRVQVGEKSYHLHFLRTVFRPGAPEPSPREGQRMMWVPTASLSTVPMLPGDVFLAELLAGTEKSQKN